jgi:hypothetical protein
MLTDREQIPCHVEGKKSDETNVLLPAAKGRFPMDIRDDI